ncbi:DUF1993 domain-containing protein [Pseudoxanthomonas putridarboris]|uniref:DUF1993 domain-containing protein n=1 Tax=Pseudoxanthomonas putridarboris TaxID=752605 RepID=A0ABU9IYF4_9GAMM
MSDSSVILHDASVGALLGGLRTLRHLLDKAEECVAAGAITEARLLDARLAEDMDPFRRQIQHASDAAKACAMRLAGRSVPSLDDTESSLHELRERIGKTEEILRQVVPADLVGGEARTIKVNFRRRWVTFDGASYLVEFALPNFFFHVTTAYAILRHLGAKVGKLDYLIDVAHRRQQLLREGSTKDAPVGVVRPRKR